MERLKDWRATTVNETNKSEWRKGVKIQKTWKKRAKEEKNKRPNIKGNKTDFYFLFGHEESSVWVPSGLRVTEKDEVEWIQEMEHNERMHSSLEQATIWRFGGEHRPARTENMGGNSMEDRNMRTAKDYRDYVMGTERQSLLSSLSLSLQHSRLSFYDISSFNAL